MYAKDRRQTKSTLNASPYGGGGIITKTNYQYYIQFLYNRPILLHSLQCFDTVGWATGRASGLYKKLGVGLLVLMI